MHSLLVGISNCCYQSLSRQTVTFFVMVLALVPQLSFMLEDEPTTGAVKSTEAEKRQYAAESLEFNCKNMQVRPVSALQNVNKAEHFAELT